MQSFWLALILTVAIGFTSFNPATITSQPYQEATQLTITEHSPRKLPSSKSMSLPDFKTQLTLEQISFVENIDLFHNPGLADSLSPHLKYASDVVLEAERIHGQILGPLLKGKRRAILVNVFTWANRGDHLITIGERALLDRFNLTLIYYCFYPGDQCDFTNLPRDEDVVVFIQGAGYIGHEAHLYVVGSALAAFPSNRVVVFPISVCCTHKNNLTSYAAIFEKHADLSILLRDRFSFEISLKWFGHAPGTRLFLTPDAAFAAGVQRIGLVPTVDIVWVKRQDWENYGDPMHDEIPLIPEEYSHDIRDWDDNWMSQPAENFMEDHQLKAASALVYLSRGKVVITDRLHAHLMCTLLGIPNVVMNSKTRKQQNYFDTWEKSVQTGRITDSSRDALFYALQLIQTYYGPSKSAILRNSV